MGETIPIQDIDSTKGETKASYCNVCTLQHSNFVLKNKNKAKGSRISTTENITAKRMKKLQAAREEHGFKIV